eukprot:GHVT01070707.1.p1 GENE.GHVT01070707.1~~GHVT01070707.1.p1  ORF type:complete len:418 (-),score=90.92 GHVT01070707.1:915-2168(-)
MREEKQLERELMRERIQEETKGKIKVERDNADVHLRSLRAKIAEERKTRMDQLAVIFSSMGAASKSLLEDKQKMAMLVGGVSALALGIYGARSGASVAGRFVESRLGKPPLVRETSRYTLRDRLRQWSPRALWRRLAAPGFKFEEEVVLEAELAERLKWMSNGLVSAKANGTPFRHVLLYGPPGTGKTLFARSLARASGLDYAIMTGGDVGPLGRSAVSELHRLFQWAEKSKKGLVLFIDEADAFLRAGRGDTEASSMSEDTRNAISAFLHHTGTESTKFCVVLATNCREVLDKAIIDRLDEYFEFPLPGYDERLRQLQMFFDEYLYQPTNTGKKIIVDEKVDQDFLKLMAKKTENFSGRQLAKLVIGMQAAVFGSGTQMLTRGLAETVLNWKLAHFNQDLDTIRREERAAKLRVTN